jgi:ribosomal protein L11 methyltransferase
MVANPFAQAASHTQVSFETLREPAEQAELFFGDVALSLSAFELDELTKRWRVDVLLEGEADKADIARRLGVLAAHYAVQKPEFTTTPVTPDMWQHNFHQFPPIEIGRMFVHGSHVTELPKVSKLNICVDAGLAFGSGEHATTEGCLALLQEVLKSNRKPALNMLDMGCGSAILAMSAAKLEPTSHILAVEIDRVSARVAAENVALNQLKNQVYVLAADGYKSALVKQAAPFDIVLANILARPLMAMAKSLESVLAEDGIAILSGLLNKQERMVIAAHQMQGFRVRRLWRKSGWSAIMMSKI